MQGLAVLPAMTAPAALAAVGSAPLAAAELLALEAELHALDIETDRMAVRPANREYR